MRRTEIEELACDDERSIAAKKRQRVLIEQVEQWLKEGRCPVCGELGRFVNFKPTCSVHGPYDCNPKPPQHQPKVPNKWDPPEEQDDEETS